MDRGSGWFQFLSTHALNSRNRSGWYHGNSMYLNIISNRVGMKTGQGGFHINVMNVIFVDVVLDIAWSSIGNDTAATTRCDIDSIQQITDSIEWNLVGVAPGVSLGRVGTNLLFVGACCCSCWSDG